MPSRIQPVTREDACTSRVVSWGNRFDITMRLDTNGREYDRGMECQVAPPLWRRAGG